MTIICFWLSNFSVQSDLLQEDLDLQQAVKVISICMPRSKSGRFYNINPCLQTTNRRPYKEWLSTINITTTLVLLKGPRLVQQAILILINPHIQGRQSRYNMKIGSHQGKWKS